MTDTDLDAMLRDSLDTMRERADARHEGRIVAHHERDHTGREGWVFGVEQPRKRDGVFVLVPGSAVEDIVLHSTRDSAETAAARRFGSAWDVYRVRAVWRYGHNDFLLLAEEPATDEQIRALRDEAAAAGDLAQVRSCERALEGNPIARDVCALTIQAGKVAAAAG